MAKFDRLHADYLVKKARLKFPTQSDDEMSAAIDAQCEALWALIRTPATALCHIIRKCELLQELVGDGDLYYDRRTYLLLASITADLNNQYVWSCDREAV